MQCAAVSYVSEAQHFCGINTNKFFRKWWCGSQFNSLHILEKIMLKDVYIHSISPDFGYPSAQTFNQRYRKIWENRLITPRPWILSWFIDVGGCESSNFYQILGSKDIKRNPSTMTFRNHENSMQAEKKCQTLEHYRPNMLELWVAQKNMSYTVPCHNDKENDPVCKQIVTVRWNVLKRNQKQITQPNCGETLCTFE